MTRWTMRLVGDHFELLYDGHLIASSIDPFELFRAQLTTMMTKGGSYA